MPKIKLFLTVTLLVVLTCSGLVAKTQSGSEGVGFLFFGDSGTAESDQYDVANGMSYFCKFENCKWTLLLGDNFYPNGVSSVRDPQWQTKFLKPYFNLKSIFRPVLGNHDYGGNIQAQIDFSKKLKYWWMPARYYSWHDTNVAFFAIDTENFDPKQQSWLEKELAASTKEWNFVYGHHPIYSYGEHGDTKHLIDRLLPLIESKVDFYLSGHDHDLQFIDRDLMKYIVSGAAAKTRKTNQGKYSQFASNELGFAHFHIEGNQAKLRILDRKGKQRFQKVFSK